MHKKSIVELSASLAKAEISSVELTQHYLKRIKQYNKNLNAFITVIEEQAMQQARLADQRRAKQEYVTPLTGIPIAHKDIFSTKDVLTSCGSRMLSNYIPPYNASIVEKLQDAGMVLLGKTNMDEFAMGSSNENSYYGSVRNPWNPDYVPGGSSGGSAAAVASRIIPCATGTDTGGSIRQPASLCGITGLKPTYGRLSRHGMIAYASSLDSGGILTGNAEDTALLFNYLACFDPKDSTSIQQPTPDYTAKLNQPLDKLRIGIPTEYLAHDLNPDVLNALEQAKSIFLSMGVTFKSISLPHTHLAIPVYYLVSCAECASNLARYDGVRYGYRCKHPKDLTDLYFRSRSEGFGSEVKRRILAGTYTLSGSSYDTHYRRVKRMRHVISNDYQNAFKEVDVILGPTAPTPAFRLGEKLKDPITMYLSDIFTVSNNLAGVPGISIPAGFSSNLPIGIQITGNHFTEAKLLNIAHQFQQQTDWHKRIPEQFA